MKAVLLSIRTEWCKKILSGEKTVEIRKTRPRLETPFKVYIYCTRAASKEFKLDDQNWDVSAKVHGGCPGKRGRVIGEFTCNDIDRITPLTSSIPGNLEERILGSCLTPQQVETYAGWKGHMRLIDCRDAYCWHIHDLKIYDRPRELDEFYRFNFCGMNGTVVCENEGCKHYEPSGSYMEPPTCAIDGCYLKRPPQSWCYVEVQN